MTRGGCPGDNAHTESFFHTMKAEVIHGARFSDDNQLRSCVRAYVLQSRAPAFVARISVTS
jgi:hypothetical protein